MNMQQINSSAQSSGSEPGESNCEYAQSYEKPSFSARD
jgi:hypothetical protein